MFRLFVVSHDHNVVPNTSELPTIFDAQVVYKDSFGKSINVPLHIMADTGATCSVFDCDFVKKNEILWRRRKIPVKIKSVSRALIPKAGKAFTCDCSTAVKDCVVPFTTEV